MPSSPVNRTPVEQGDPFQTFDAGAGSPKSQGVTLCDEWGSPIDPVIFGPRDFYLYVRKGHLKGAFLANVAGRNFDVDVSDHRQDLWGDKAGPYTGIPSHFSGAERLQIVSSHDDDTDDGPGARIVQLIGLDENWNRTTEFVPLHGTLPVTTNKRWHRNQVAVLEEIGEEHTNVGTITIRGADTPSNVFGRIEPGKSFFQPCLYTVPGNHEGFLTEVSIQQIRASGADGSAKIALMTQSDKDVQIVLREFVVSSAGFVNSALRTAPIPLPAKTDVWLRVTEVSDPDTQVVGSMTLVVFNGG